MTTINSSLSIKLWRLDAGGDLTVTVETIAVSGDENRQQAVARQYPDAFGWMEVSR